MNWLNKHLSLKADLMVTLLNGVIVMNIDEKEIINRLSSRRCCSKCGKIYGLIARIHGLDILGEFLLIKRTLSAGVGILLVGVNIALPNYLSRNFEKSYGDLFVSASELLVFLV